MKKLVVLTAFFFVLSLVFGQDVKEGEKMFNSNCKACHSIGKGKIVGPDLKNVLERRKEEWLLKFIKTPGAVIKSGDPDAKKLFEEHNQILMPDHTFLTDADIKNMLGYITDQSKAEVVEVKKNDLSNKNDVIQKDAPVIKAAVPLTAMDYFLYILTGFCFVLVLITAYLIFQVRKLFLTGKEAN